MMRGCFLLGPLMIGGRNIVPERTISYDTLILAKASQRRSRAATATRCGAAKHLLLPLKHKASELSRFFSARTPLYSG